MRSRPHRTPRDLFDSANPILEWIDRTLYVAVGALFLLSALGMGIYTVVDLIANLIRHPDMTVPNHIIEFVNGLLLVLIILEVFSTVQSYLETHSTSLRPFLYIGIISATRRILAIGAASALEDPNLSDTVFRNRMIDLAINAGVVLALALALFLFARRGESSEPATRGELGGREQLP